MIKEPRVPLLDLVLCLSNAMDLISPDVVNHHKQVAYIAFNIATELGLSAEEQDNLLWAGLLHDSGALSLKDRIDTLEFEFGFKARDPYKHAYRGYLLLKNFEPLPSVALIVRYHHLFWDEVGNSELEGKVPLGSHILHLADRISILINKQQEVLGQVKRIYEKIVEYSGKMFMPEAVDAFKSLAAKEYFWFDAASPSISSIIARGSRSATIELDTAGLLNLTDVFCHIIDFRSRFTATHSSGVAATAGALAGFMGFSERECQMIKIAGRLHDLGKLAVPAEILEKPAKLTEDEFNIIKSHTFYTYRILETINELDVINTWASFHHERLNGMGYPFHHKGEDLSLGSRIMAVSDVFAAVTEDRPHRKGMTSDRVLRVLEQMADNSSLDSNIVSTLRLHFDEVNSICMVAQAAASKGYQEFGQQIHCT